jgi:hypothetical protein
MPPTLIRRSLLGFNYFSSPSQRLSKSHNIEFRRGEATYRRHIKKLSIPPAPSFGPQKPTKRPADVPPSSHIVFNPPASAAHVYHTPLKFLPQNDRRRQLYTNSSAPSLYNVAANSKTHHTPSPVSKPGTALHEVSRTLPTSLLPRVPDADPMPPPLKPVEEKKYHVTPEQVAEMQKLRRQDPSAWTIDRLAEWYGCSTLFVRICAKNWEAGKAHAERMEAIRARWGRKRALAREDRRRRKELWGRDA